ncbi:hypothetical protein [Kingella oralis]|uniref:hypothetical protein n=1 Tax=Kingella oralis TaxID=505 RepID=UPI002D811124|nr:hypothetical protein [Kingella oralis]
MAYRRHTHSIALAQAQTFSGCPNHRNTAQQRQPETQSQPFSGCLSTTPQKAQP